MRQKPSNCKGKLAIFFLVISFANACAKRRSSVEEPSSSQNFLMSSSESHNNVTNYSDPLLLEKANRVFLANGENGLYLNTPTPALGNRIQDSEAMEIDSSRDLGSEGSSTAHPVTDAKFESSGMDVDIPSEKNSTASYYETKAAPPPTRAPYIAPIPRLVSGSGDTLKLEYEDKTISYYNGSVLAFNQNLEKVPIDSFQGIQFQKGEESACICCKIGD